MSLPFDFERWNTIVGAAGYHLQWTKDGSNPNKRYRFQADMVWKILADLDSVGATPEAIGSSYEELEGILQANGC